MTDEIASQFECTEVVLEVTPDASVISNLGTASQVLYAAEDRDRNFYMTGAMGGTTALGIGVAMCTDEPVTVLEGDGSLLMSLGVLGTIGRYDPPNLTVVVWENRAFGTTGGQTTQAEIVDLAAVAEDCGVTAYYTDDVEGFEAAYREATDADGAAVIVSRVEPVIDFEGGYTLDLDYTKRRFKGAMPDG